MHRRIAQTWEWLVRTLRYRLFLSPARLRGQRLRPLSAAQRTLREIRRLHHEMKEIVYGDEQLSPLKTAGLFRRLHEQEKYLRAIKGQLR